ncbi:MAG TPA: hypothetical protein DFS52_31235 [Myxococcales bacterium]|nr:hypothetical protein [Myxococcales bacterium]
MKAIPIIGAAVLALSLVGCGGKAARSDEARQPKQASNSATEAIAKRAAFDLGCPEDQLTVTVIETGNMMRPWTFGVAGCNKRATYLSRAGTIINQSIVVDAPAAPPAAADAAAPDTAATEATDTEP